ncbi:hypothetical protein [Roseibium algae]|uniref:Uncharacterized protein n=1 Tax=Roseibium algae TaxID=3123038 RepID=A0ABU8TGZ5_9HYPH
MTSKMLPTPKVLATCVLGVAVIYSLMAYNNYLKDKCSALDPDKVKFAIAEYFIKHKNKGSVSIIGEDGEYVSYPQFEFDSAQDYLKQYPDCCRYYPDGRPTDYTLHPIQISFWERFFGAKCAFVGLSVHSDFLVDGVVTKDTAVSGQSLIINNQYQISKDPKDR